MNNVPYLVGLALVLWVTSSFSQSVRVPAVPLITHDPYFSIWSMNDKLTDGPTRHWTGAAQPLTGLVRIDGRVFRWMGSAPQALPAIPQTALEITATRTTYHFEEQGLKLDVSFLSPLLPNDLELMSRPVSYITMTAAATDGASHRVQLLFDASPVLAVDTPTQQVVWSRSRLQGMNVLRASHFQQPVLEKSGDDVRIDWGSVLLAVPGQKGVGDATQLQDVVISAFASGKPLSEDDVNMPQRASEGAVLAVSLDFGDVSAGPASRHILIGYDDLYSIEFLNRWMPAYWRQKGKSIGDLLETEI